MSKKPKSESSAEEEKGDPAEIVEDQKSRGYYYDDAHGYQTYVPEGDDDDNADIGQS